jgi:hypothetical protein
MKRPVRLGIASLKGLGIVVALGAAAHAAMPYLPLIGPPPLRLQTVASPAAVAPVKFQAPPAVAATNAPAVAGTGITPVTNAVASTGLNSPPAIPLLVPESPDQSLGDSFSASVFAMPTPDLLGITPQMLAAYFRPVQLGTNSATLVGQFPVSFMPPLPPDKSSHAEYIVK